MAAVLRIRRWARFNVVGASGFVLQTTAVWLLAEQAGLYYLGAVAVALELAMLHNYVWHARWTWRDRRPGGRFIRGLVLYHAFAGAMALANLACVALLVEAWGVPYLLASAVAVGICAVVNFKLADSMVFPEGTADRAAPSCPVFPGAERRWQRSCIPCTLPFISNFGRRWLEEPQRQEDGWASSEAGSRTAS